MPEPTPPEVPTSSARPEQSEAESKGVEAPRHVVFRAGPSLYGLPLESVREVVVPRPPFVRVPRAAASVRGAMNLRGRVVAVVDLPAFLGVTWARPERSPAAPESKGAEHVVILERGRRALGFLVGPVLSVEALLLAGRAEAREPADVVCGTGTRERHGTMVTLLDPDVLEARATALFGPVC